MKDYKQYFIIPAHPQEVFAALTNPATLQLWTGEPAVMSTEPGSEFSLFGDSITGTNISFEPGKKIIQYWDFGDQPEPSEVTIILHDHKQGTSVELRHTNIPNEAYEDMVEGWNNVYFAALADFYS